MFARYWLHNGMLTFNGRKMSKSLGNVMVLHELLQKHPPELLRYLSAEGALSAAARLVGHHDSRRRARRWMAGMARCAISPMSKWMLRNRSRPRKSRPRCSMISIHPKHSPLSLASRPHRVATPAWNNAESAKTALLGAGALLGLLQQDPEAWFKQGLAAVESASEAGGAVALDAREIDDLLAQRDAARKARDFAEADRIRDELAAKGIAIEDGAQGTRWKVVNPNECRLETRRPPTPRKPR